MAIHNPLRYPGAKSKLYEYVRDLLAQENLRNCTFIEPFAGSCALSLKLLENRDIGHAVVNERDPLIYSFWVSVFQHTDELLELIENTPITLNEWHRYSEYRNSENLFGKTVVEKGFACLFLNRTNFSGILNANPLGGKAQTSQYKIDCRFNRESLMTSVQQLSQFADRITVCNHDALDFMKRRLKNRRPNSFFVYIDPPYYKAGPELYRYYYSHADHEALANYIKPKAFPWLISYDDAPEIHQLYETSTFVNLHMDYSVHTSRKGSELLISNLEIPPLVQEEQQQILNIG